MNVCILAWNCWRLCVKCIAGLAVKYVEQQNAVSGFVFPEPWTPAAGAAWAEFDGVLCGPVSAQGGPCSSFEQNVACFCALQLIWSSVV